VLVVPLSDSKASVSLKEARRRYERSGAEDGPIFFDLDDQRVIDCVQGGNSARRINHS
jgi:hypothetical protein